VGEDGLGEVVLYERGADFDDHVFDWFFSRGSAESAVEGSSLAGVVWVMELHCETFAPAVMLRAQLIWRKLMGR
jgi:hypothetical protein